MAQWKSREHLEDHFRRHGATVHARDLAAYARMADETVARGVRFTYRRTNQPRVGYYDARLGRFVVTDAVTHEILSLSRKNERYVRQLGGSTYGR